MSELTTTTKPAYKSWAFWLAAAATIVGLLWSSGAISEGGTTDKVIGYAAMLLAQLGYPVVRGTVK